MQKPQILSQFTQIKKHLFPNKPTYSLDRPLIYLREKKRLL